jgi:phosphate-selective porin OprO/OprP
MNRMLITLMISLGMVAAALAQDEPTPPTPQPEKKQDDQEHKFRFYWKQGIHFESDDKSFAGQIGGRIMHDSIYQNADTDYETSSGEVALDENQFRGARIHFAGTIKERFEFKIGMDFAGGSSGFRDVYVRLKDFPFSDTTLGHFKEPFSLESQTPLLDTVFMERALNDGIIPHRNFGLMVSGVGEQGRLTYAIGIFRDTDSAGDANDISAEGDHAATARLTYLPIYDEATHTILHIGAALSIRAPAGNEFLATVSPELDTSLTPVSQDSPLGVERITIFHVEGALLMGSLTAHCAYTQAQLELLAGGSDPDLDGWYVAFSWFLTGEHRPYNNKKGAFGPITPNTELFWDGDDGTGAVEIAIRFSSTDWNDLIPLGPGGGALDNITVGINWFLNANMRLTLNLIRSDLDDTFISETGNHVGFRFQLNF